MQAEGGGDLGAVGCLGGGGGWGSGRGVEGERAGDISSTLPYTALPHGASPQRDFAQQRTHERETHVTWHVRRGVTGWN